MIQSNYKIAFRVEVFHSYFENNVCNCLRFKPGNETLKLQKRFGFKLQSNSNGFDFYADSKTSLAAVLNYISMSTGQTYFDFDIESTNPAFSYFTELPVSWKGQLLYDSSSPLNQFDNGTLILGAAMSDLPGSLTAGKLSVHFDDLLRYTAGKGYADLCIYLNARNTQWQYFVINKSAVQFVNPVIKSNTAIEFDLPEMVTIPTGQKALLFSSGKNLIQLSKKPKYKFTLMDHAVPGTAEQIKRPAGRIIFKGLPNPDPQHIGIVNINGNQHVSSPMYVFI